MNTSKLFSILHCIVAVLLISLLASCNSEPTNPPETKSGQDPNGGSWHTIVLSSSAAVSAPAPAAETDSLTKKELEEIKAKQAAITPEETSVILHWDSSAVIRWNEIARSLVIKYKTNPPSASRIYALLSIAQYDASVVAWRLKYLYNRKTPSTLDGSIKPPTQASGPSYPSDHATIAGASASILASIYPLEQNMLDSLARVHEESRITGGYNFRSDVQTGDSIGRAVGAIVLSSFATDGSQATWNDTIPKGPQYWYSSQKPPVAPLLPLWGNVKCWVITDMSAVEAPPPPEWGSAAYLDGLHEVRQISDTRTAEQTAIAIKWADGGGTYTPPGHWNSIASESILPLGWSTLRQARAFSLLNMAMLDAGVCCWKSKYKYWLIRPSQADTLIKLAVPLPNFPSYTSGHSSFSGAAAEVLGYLIPAQKTDFQQMASEAAISRVYGGIHYRFDSDAGLAAGQKIGALAVARGKSDGSD
jgi:membrane-associated phospholipid phosphatase